MKDACTNCRFHYRIDHEGFTNHFCRYDPPEFIPPNSSAMKPIDPIGWCGKHEPVAKPKAATKRVPAPRIDPKHGSFSKLSDRAKA